MIGTGAAADQFRSLWGRFDTDVGREALGFLAGGAASRCDGVARTEPVLIVRAVDDRSKACVPRVRKLAQADGRHRFSLFPGDAVRI